MSKRSGYVVETKSGKRGVALHSDKEINGKVVVRLDEGGNILCDRSTLKMIGFQD